MDSYHSSSTTNKWQQMATIVSQYPLLSQPNLARQFKKLCIIRRLSESILIFSLQYTGLVFSTLTPQFFPLWFASGTACAFVFMRGYSILPTIGLGTFFAYYFAGSSLLLAFNCAIVFTLQAFLLVWVSHRYISPTLIFCSRTLFLKFILYSSTLTAITSLTLVLLYQSVWPHPPPFFHLFLHWWLANFNGILIFSCAIIALDTFFPQLDSLKQLNKLLLTALYVSLLIITATLLFSHHFIPMAGLALLTLLLTILISICFSWCGVISANFLLGALLSLAVYCGAPLVTTPFSLKTILFLQVVLCLNASLGLFLTIR